MKALRESQKAEMDDSAKTKLPRLTLQKLTKNRQCRTFLVAFERISVQQKWPKEVWATQVAVVK